jgi:glutamyl-tRNA synthetase
MGDISLNTIKAFALENALRHEGKANPSAVLSGLFSQGLERSKVKDIMPLITKTVAEVNALPPKVQETEFEALKDLVSKRKVREGLPELPNVHKEVVMRFAPFPSGPLHMGNALPAILNDEFVKKYGGKLLLVIDDTIGSAEKPIEPQAYDLIPEGLRWLGINFDKTILYKSDRIETYYEYAEELLKKGYMYVCNCERELMSKNKESGIECSCRQFSGEEQILRWKQMFSASEGSMCVRLKTSMTDSDPAFRDRVMFRISDRPHARTNTKYRVYPLLDFSWAIDDHLLGITHILRGMELVMETRVEKFIWDIFGWIHPEVIYNGHFAIEGIKISKSKGSQEVKSGTYSGWNDPRTWSLQSLRDRGIQPEAIRQFILSMGIKKTSVTVPIDILYTANKKLLDDVPRYFFVRDPQEITIMGCPPLKAHIPLHPSKSLGTKNYETGQEFLLAHTDLEAMKRGNYRLMHLLNFKLDDLMKLRQRSFSFISQEPDESLHARLIHWLPKSSKNIATTILMPDGSLLRGLSEPKTYELKEGSLIQFERFGFVRLHRKSADHLEFWFAHQ